MAMTGAEALDAAETGEEFGQVVLGIFAALGGRPEDDE